MRKWAFTCAVVFSSLATLAWSQPHEIASQRAVALAMLNPWARLPTPPEITQAFSEYTAKLGKNVSVTSGPSKMHVPWEKDPLQANKVVLTIRADDSPQTSQNHAVVLRYDFLTSKFKFEGVLLPGIKRYPGDKSTSSFLEPQDLTYLAKDWISVSSATRKAVTPDDVIFFVEDYIRMFEMTCFGQVVQLGNAATYRKALSNHLTLVSPSTSLSKTAEASLESFTTSWAVTAPPNELRIRANLHAALLTGKLSYSRRQTLYHETTHQIEWTHGAKRGRSDPTAERNTGYLDEVANALRNWQPWETQLMQGKWSTNAQDAYRDLEIAIRDAEKKFKPELSNLEAWAGIRIQIDDIRKHYLSNACGELLRRVVDSHLRGTPITPPPAPPAQPGSAVSPPPKTPPVTQSTAGGHIVYSMIFDKSNGRPVAGVALTVLRPGVTTQDWIASKFDTGLIASQGISDASGMVSLSPNLKKGNTYSLMAVHPSYKAVRYESLQVTQSSPEPLKITLNLVK
jgi:hypothetical protein